MSTRHLTSTPDKSTLRGSRGLTALVAGLLMSVEATAALAQAKAALPEVTASASQATVSPLGMAIIGHDQVAMRSAPRESAQTNTILWQGELVEVRAERRGYYQVWDYKRERGGYISASQATRTHLAPEESAELLAVLRFLKHRPGSEALGMGYAAAYFQAASQDELAGEAAIDALDALATLGERLARRASTATGLTKSQQAALSAHLDVAARYGLKFTSTEKQGQLQICYDGEANRRVLAMRANPAQKARAALALTRADCQSEDAGPTEKAQIDAWRAEVLDRVDASALLGHVKSRVAMRRASVWASIAYGRARRGEPAIDAASRAISELARVTRAEVLEEDQAEYEDAAMRVNAVRWAAHPAPEVSRDPAKTKRPVITTVAGEPGETCVLLVDAEHGKDKPLARRCTYALVWLNAVSMNREGNALALAVQPTDGWRELWVFHRVENEWSVRVLPPANVSPGLGYAEFAGWVPGGGQMLVAREARGEGKYKRSFDLVALHTLVPQKQAADPAMLGAFQRWKDPAWARMSVALR